MKKLEKAVEQIIDGSIENRFGMKLLETAKKVPVESLKFNRDYQRATETARKESAKKGMIACGQFLPDKPITVNQDNEIVDGQHRYIAAKEIGMTHVWAVRYLFTDKQKEAEFFIFINNFDQRLKTADYWYANYLAKDTLAVFLYEMNENPESALKNMIALKGSETNSKWTISNAQDALGTAIGFDTNWKKDSHHHWVARIEAYGNKTVMHKTNLFVKWYHDVFGLKSETPWSHRKDVFRAIKFLYLKLEEIGNAHSKDTVNKMKSFVVDSSFLAAPLIGKKNMLVSFYNKNRKKNTLTWEIK